MLKLAIGADHRGFEQKQFILNSLKEVSWTDVGCFTPQRCDYPEFARKVVELMQTGKVDAGILLCGSGIGMVIAANRFKGIYAGLVWNETIAKKAKEDDNVNIVALPSDYVSDEQAVAIIKSWLGATFKGGRYQERLTMIDQV